MKPFNQRGALQPSSSTEAHRGRPVWPEGAHGGGSHGADTRAERVTNRKENDRKAEGARGSVCGRRPPSRTSFPSQLRPRCSSAPCRDMPHAAPWGSGLRGVTPRLGKRRGNVGPKARATRKVSGKKTCFHQSKIKKLLWFLHQPPHFSYKKANSEGPPA